MKIEKAVKRFQEAKEIESKRVRARLDKRREKFELQSQKLRELAKARAHEMETIFRLKFELAAQHRKMQALKAANVRMKKAC